jgi:DNA-binding MarR family transcriptional regulator
VSSRGELLGEVNLALREVRPRLLQVNQAVGEALGLSSVEMEFIDLIARTTPVTPSELAARTGLSPATVTGVLDRLEKEGWIRRERDTEDRRRVFVHADLTRTPELFGRFAGMLNRVATICKRYSDTELETVIGFLRQVRDAGDEAVAELREGEPKR